MNRQVILFLPSYESGGVERNATYFANGMVSRGYQVHLLYCRKVDTWFSRLDSRVGKVKISRLVRLPLIHERISDAISMMLFAPLKVLKIRNKGSVVITSFQSNIIAIFIARLCRVRVVVRLSNHYEVIAHEKSVLRKISEIGKKIVYRYANVVLANSSELARDYAEFLELPVDTIQNPVDFKNIGRLMEEQPVEKMFGNRSDSKPIVISAGRLTAQKNFALLLQAMVEVTKEIPCDLVILGEGEERVALEKLAKRLEIIDCVHFLGYRDNIYQYFARADVFVLSSNYEGMPNVLIEAIACGLPAVATRCKSGPTEILCDGKGGELVPVNDHHALAAAIVRTFNDSEAAKQKLAVAARNLFCYDLAKIEDKYDGMLSNCFLAES